MLAFCLLVVGMFMLIAFREMFFRASCPLCGSKRDHEKFCPWKDVT